MEPGTFFFVLSFVSMFVLRKKKGNRRGRSGGRHGSGGNVSHMVTGYHGEARCLK